MNDGGSAGRPYHVPGEDDEVMVLTLTRGDFEMIFNALSLYSHWIRLPGTLPLEYGDVTPEQERVLETLRAKGITAEDVGIQLKAGAAAHASHLRDEISEALKQ